MCSAHVSQKSRTLRSKFENWFRIFPTSRRTPFFISRRTGSDASAGLSWGTLRAPSPTIVIARFLPEGPLFLAAAADTAWLSIRVRGLALALTTACGGPATYNTEDGRPIRRLSDCYNATHGRVTKARLTYGISDQLAEVHEHFLVTFSGKSDTGPTKSIPR